jgi:nucleotide-binding universal stress UspA family protein
VFERILVPLDTSACAQDALFVGKAVAARCGGALLLLDSVSGPASLPDTATAQKRLALQVASLQAEGFDAHAMVRDGLVADTIAAVAEDQRADLIVLAPHPHDQRDGLGRLSGLLHQRVSAHLIAHAPAPLLTVPRREDLAITLRFLTDPQHTRRAIAVALDGSELAERALPIAIEIARGLDQHIHLVRVVPAIAMDALGRAMTAVRRMAIQTLFADMREAHGYLAAVRRAILATSPVRVQKRVLVGDPVEKLVATTHSNEVGLLALTTHGRGAPARAVMGSVAAVLMLQSPIPLLIIPPISHQPDQTSALIDHLRPTTADIAKD